MTARYDEKAWKALTEQNGGENNPQVGDIGHAYDNMANGGWQHAYRQNIIKWVWEIYAFDENDYKASGVLDIGCNQGQYLRKLREVGINEALTGVDVNLDSIEAGKDECAAKNIKLSEGDARKLSFGDKQFHTVLLLGVLMHMPDPVEVLNEAARVAGSHLIVSSYGRSSRQGDQARFMWTAGFLNYYYTKEEVEEFISQCEGRWSLEMFMSFEIGPHPVYQYKFKRL